MDGEKSMNALSKEFDAKCSESRDSIDNVPVYLLFNGHHLVDL